MEPDDVGGPEAKDDVLLEKLRRLREQFGDSPTLLAHIDKTVDALNKMEHPGGNDAEDGGNAD